MEQHYDLNTRRHVDKIFKKMQRSDRYNLEIIYKKLEEVCDNPEKFKPLNAPMQNLRRVHILKSFVIIYSIDETTHSVWIEYFAHHDEVYD